MPLAVAKQQTAFSQLAQALSSNLTNEATIDASVARLFYVRMRLGEFDPPEDNPYRQVNASVIERCAHQ